MWSWQTGIVDLAAHPECESKLNRALTDPATASLFPAGSALFQDTTAMLMCEDEDNKHLRTVALPNFTATLWQDHKMRTEWLYAQPATTTAKNGTASVAKWLGRALALYKQLAAAGATLPSGLHFDVEYESGHDVGTGPLEQFLRIAALVRQQVDAAGLGSKAPRLVYDVSDSLATTVAACPDGTSDKTGLSCVLQYADSLTIMAYRSFAVEYTLDTHTWCDGILPHAAQFLVAAKATNDQGAASSGGMNKTVVVGVETMCDVNYDPMVDQKVSFCGRYHGSEPGEATATSYLIDSLRNVTSYLKQTDYARAAFPCLDLQTDLPLPASADLWATTPVGASSSGQAVDSLSPSFAIHSFAGLSSLAYNDDIAAVCPNVVPRPHDTCL